MAINLSDNINLNSPKILDYRYGPWTSVNNANSNVNSLQRKVGLTVGIINGNSLNEYWYYSGITDSDLIIKNTSTDLSVFYQYTADTKTKIDSKLNISDFNTYSSTTNNLIGNKYDKAGGIISGNVTITGNLTLLGTGNTINVQNSVISSPILLLASGSTLATLNAGLLINRATTGSTAFIYKENLGEYQLGYTTATTVSGLSTVNFDSYGKLRLGGLYTTNIYDRLNSSGSVDDVLFSKTNGVEWGNLNYKLNVSDFNSFLNNLYSYTSNTNNLIGTKLNITDFSSYSSNTNTLIGTKLNITDFSSYSSNTNNLIGTKLNITDFSSYSSNTNTLIGTKLNITDFSSYSSNTNNLIGTKLNITDFSSYSSNTNNLIGTKLNITDFSSYSSNTNTLLSNKVIEVGTCNGSTIRINNNNDVTTDYGTVLGGQCNTASGYYSISDTCGYSTVSGGYRNTALDNYSFVGGGKCNTAQGISVSLISGYSTIVGGCNNKSNGFYSFIGGGSNNQTCGLYSTVGGGYCNIASYLNNGIGITDITGSIVGGGLNNTASGLTSSILGGCNNTTLGCFSSILGGSGNKALCNNTFILGSNITATTQNTSYVENLNIKNGIYDSNSLLGGSGNILSSTGSGVRWGTVDNLISGSTSVTSKLNIVNFNSYSSNTNNLIGTKLNISDFNPYSSNTNTLIGTKLNVTDFNTYSAKTDSRLLFSSGTIGSTFRVGSGNQSLGSYSTVSGGYCNTTLCNYSVIGGGFKNTIETCFSNIVGGQCNRICGIGTNQIIGGGCNNTSSGCQSFVGGGGNNKAFGTNSVVGGGCCNTSCQGQSFVGGGFKNLSCNAGSFVGGGYCNTSCSIYSVIGGGISNTVSGCYSGILGGQCNLLTVKNSFIIGSNITGTTENTTYVESINIKNSIYDNNNSCGTNGQILISSGSKICWDNPVYSGTTSCGVLRLFSSNIVDCLYSSVLGGSNNTTIGNTSTILNGSFNMNYSCNSSINNGTMNIVGGSVISYPVSQISGVTQNNGFLNTLSLTSCVPSQFITQNTYTIKPYTISGSGGGAVLDISFGTNTYAPTGYTVTNVGSGYKVGDVIRIPSYIPGFGYQQNLITYTVSDIITGSTNIGRVTISGDINSGNSNFIPSVSGILTSLGIYAYNSAGGTPSSNTYNVTGFTSGVGSGARLSLTYDGNIYPTSISVLSGGTNYSIGDIIVIDGTSVGLSSSYDDLYLTATSVSSIAGDKVILYNPSNNNTYTSTVIGSSYSNPNTTICFNSSLGSTTTGGFIINSCRLTTSGLDNVVLGGTNNVINDTSCSFIGNGKYNKINSAFSTIGNGKCNTISTSSVYSTILGGCSNTLSNCHSFILGTNITTSANCTTFVNCLNINNIPTSAAGLPKGSVWNNCGVLNIT